MPSACFRSAGELSAAVCCGARRVDLPAEAGRESGRQHEYDRRRRVAYLRAYHGPVRCRHDAGGVEMLVQCLSGLRVLLVSLILPYRFPRSI